MSRIPNQHKLPVLRPFLVIASFALASCVGGIGEQNIDNSVATVITGPKQTLAAAQEDLCQGIDAPENLGCQTVDPLQPASPDQAAQKAVEGDLTLGFSPGDLGGRTKEWWDKYGVLAREI